MDAGSLLGWTSAAESAPAALLAMRSLMEGRRKGRSDPELALPACLAFERACARWVFDMHLIAKIGVPPSILGAVWTWPAVFRAHRTMIEASRDMVTAFAEIVTLASDEVAEAGFEVGQAIADLTTGFQVGKVGRSKVGPEFDEALERAGKCLREFALAVRADLELPPSTHPHDSED